MAVRKLGEGQKLLVVGKRMSVEKVKEERHESKEDQAASFEKLQAKMGNEVNALDEEQHLESLSHSSSHWQSFH